jgi:hypothetical protein
MPCRDVGQVASFPAPGASNHARGSATRPTRPGVMPGAGRSSGFLPPGNGAGPATVPLQVLPRVLPAAAGRGAPAAGIDPETGEVRNSTHLALPCPQVTVRRQSRRATRY